MDARTGETLALLVHKGFLSADAARKALAERAEDETLPETIGRLGYLDTAEAVRLFGNRVGEEPQLTRYEIVRRIGDGGTAIVFEGIDRKSGEHVALKILREEFARDRARLERFVAEAKMLCELEHEGLVRGFRVAKDQGTVFLAMELLPSETLEDRLVAGERFGESEALRAIRDVASSLVYLRGKGIVHRDLKPGNMIRTEDGSVKLIDLGFAARIGSVEESSTTVGTVAYIAPEQARGEGDLDARADIYSLGATLYHLVVGEPPFAGEDNQEVLEKQVFAELSSERIKALGLSPTMHYLIEKMMAKDKAIRFQDASEIVCDLEEKIGDDLEQGSTGATISGKAPSPGRGSARP
ncbi:MAG: serine/threonine protein kinase, partial [Planctomycetes bacterium]|nr:serine/threonine protein kinase [Planctomycetota bacterium]